jgi:hypothetical protein
MEIHETKPARAFKVGLRGEVELSEVAKIRLNSEEMVTFMGEGGVEYDVARKTWGFYATPSLNYRLPRFGLRPVLVKNPQGRWFVLLIEGDGGEAFKEYCKSEEVQLVAWLDDEATLAKIEAAL